MNMTIKMVNFTNLYYIVSETDEELLSDESDKKLGKKKRANNNKWVFTLSQFSKLMNSKKVYSDEFDMNFFEHRGRNYSTINDPINEDIESEN